MPDNNQEVRVFVGIPMPDPVIGALTDLQQQLGATGFPLRMVRPEGIHITLAFIGEIPTNRTGGVTEAVRRAAAGLPAFTLRAEGVGAFPNTRRPRTLWVGIEGEAHDRAVLQSLYNNVARELRAAKFSFDSKADPHLTLARVREQATPGELPLIGQALQDLRLPAPISFRIDEVAVIRSVLQRGGSVYSNIATVALGSDA